MKKRFVFIVILSMVMLGAISGCAFYFLFMPVNDILILHCIATGVIFGSLNSFFTIFFIKKYSIIKSNNDKIGQEIRVDKLTELYNRFALENDLESFNSDTVYSMIFLDIDNFSKFNNTYGHHVGDKVLKNCANIIKNTIRSSDIAYRYGGEELLVILGGCTKKDAAWIGQRIVQNIRNYDNTPYSKMTISAGIASMPDDAQTLDQLLKASDSALLKAKSQGKDQLVVF